METLKLREKVIIAVFGPANKGKSTAIVELASRFPFELKSERIHPKEDTAEPLSDIVCKGQFMSKTGQKATLGICSFGDDRSILEKYFLPFVVDGRCDVIVVACHNHRDVDENTYNFIADVALANDYRLITTTNLLDNDVWWKKTPFTPFLVNGVNINEIFADNMISLIQNIV